MTCSPRVERRVERLCEQGCRAVLGYIEALRAGRDLPEFAGISAADRTEVLRELEGIMSVYHSRCRL
jgi:hypothetical protein